MIPTKTCRPKKTPAAPTSECVACGAEGSYVRALTRTRKDLRGETISVQHHHWKCRECGVAVLGDAEMDEAMQGVTTSYRASHDLHDCRILSSRTSITHTRGK